MTATERGVYLFHLEPRYRHAGHYLGFAESIPRRVHEHRNVPSKASPLLRAATAAGGTFTVARVWLGAGRELERRLKRGGGLSRHCPVCLELGRVPASRLRGSKPRHGVTPPA